MLHRLLTGAVEASDTDSPPENLMDGDSSTTHCTLVSDSGRTGEDGPEFWTAQDGESSSPDNSPLQQSEQPSQPVSLWPSAEDSPPTPESCTAQQLRLRLTFLSNITVD